MKKITSLLLTLAMLLSLLQSTAFAADPMSMFNIAINEPNSSIIRMLSVRVSMPNSDTIHAEVMTRPDDESYITSFLASSPVQVSIPCDEPWKSADVTYSTGGDTLLRNRISYDEDSACYYIEFYVALLGTYTITNTTPQPAPNPDPGPSGSTTTPSAPTVPDAPKVDTSSPAVDTKTETNADGSTTKTEILANGAVVETTTKADGSSVSTATQTETKETAEGKTTTTTTSTTTKDASGAVVKESREEVVVETAEGKTINTTLVTESKDKTEKTVTETKTTVDETGKEVTVTSAKTETTAADGSKGTTTVSEDGKVEAKTELSAKAIAEASKSGEAAPLPMPAVSAGEDSKDAPVVTIKTGTTKAVEVEIPVEDVTPGVVAVMVMPDGTEKVVQQSVPTENGVALEVQNGAVVKLVDRSEDFKDVHTADHWGKSSIDFASSRDLMNGTDAGAFSPNMTTTRGMVFTVLARFDGHDTAPARPEDWQVPGTDWAVKNGISSGEDPSGTVTREQIVTLLWRYAGSPTPKGDLSGYAGTDVLSDWAESAMRWAVENGIIKGRDGGDIAPQSHATRAEFTHMLYLAAKVI